MTLVFIFIVILVCYGIVAVCFAYGLQADWNCFTAKGTAAAGLY